MVLLQALWLISVGVDGRGGSNLVPAIWDASGLKLFASPFNIYYQYTMWYDQCAVDIQLYISTPSHLVIL